MYICIIPLNVFSNRSSLLMMLCRGLYMSDVDINRIVPVLSTFCSMFSHSLHTLHDADFYGDNPGMQQFAVTGNFML